VLTKNEHIIFNPFDNLDLARTKTRNTRKSVDEKEIKLFLDSIEGKEYLSIRDRTIFELMYGTGLRVSEVVNLKITDIDLNLGRLLVEQGKGKKDRIVPLGKNLVKWLQIYLDKSRKKLLRKRSEQQDRESLFLNNSGKKIRANTIRVRLKKQYKELNLDETKISPHVIRHSFATHMLENGVSIKHVKDILGHESMETTVGYTHFNIKSLKRILKRYHPRENDLYVEFKADAKLLSILSR